MLLKSTTTDIIKILNSNIYHNIDVPVINLSNESNKMLSILFYKFRIANNDWDNINLKYEITKNDKNEYNISNYPKSIQQIILSMKTIVCKTEFSINNHLFTINLIFNNNQQYKKSYFKQILKQIYIWLHVATTYASSECSKTLNIYIHFTTHIKQLPSEPGLSIDQLNVNTAYTFACIPNNELHIYREEEWFKVFIHETFHSLGLDFAKVDSTESNATILDIFPIKSDVRISETYCEMWAEIINVMFIAYYKTRINNNQQKWIDELLKKTTKMLQNEQKMSLFQSAKILEYYGLKYQDLYNPVNIPSHILQTKYKEKTHVLSYYIIKSIFMYNINVFIEFCCDLNINYSINFNKQGENVNQNIMKFCGLIRKIHDDSKYITYIDTVLHNLQILKNKDFNSKYILNTLRMSLYEVA